MNPSYTHKRDGKYKTRWVRWHLNQIIGNEPKILRVMDWLTCVVSVRFLSEIPNFWNYIPKCKKNDENITNQRTHKQIKEEEEEEEKLVLSRYIRHDWSDDDERNAAEKPDDREERFFVEFDREERRYLFHTHSSEIEFDWYQILVRGEYGNEKVD